MFTVFMFFQVLGLFFFLLCFLSNSAMKVFFLFFVGVLILVVGTNSFFAYWFSYFLVLLFLSGVFLVLLYMSSLSWSSMNKPVSFYLLILSFPFIFNFGFFIQSFPLFSYGCTSILYWLICGLLFFSLLCILGAGFSGNNYSLRSVFIMSDYEKSLFIPFKYYGKNIDGKSAKSKRILKGPRRLTLSQIDAMSSSERQLHLKKVFCMIPCFETPPNMSREEYLDVWSYWRMCYFYGYFPVINPRSSYFIVGESAIIGGCCVMFDPMWKPLHNFEEILVLFFEFYSKYQSENYSVNKKNKVSADLLHKNIWEPFSKKHGLPLTPNRFKSSS